MPEPHDRRFSFLMRLYPARYRARYGHEMHDLFLRQATDGHVDHSDRAVDDFAAGGDDGETVFANGREARQGFFMLGVAVACYSIWLNFGFLPMAIALGPLSLVALGVFRPVICLVVMALTALVTLVFTYGLGVQLI